MLSSDTFAAKISVFREYSIKIAVNASDLADTLIRAAKAKRVTLRCGVAR